MQSTSTTLTAKKHVVVFSADDIKSVAMNAAKTSHAVTDSQLESSNVVVAADGEVTVTLVEHGVEAPIEPASAPASAAPTLKPLA